MEQQDIQEVETPPEAEALPERNWEAEAQELGWRPKEEYNGDPEHWKDAQAFVEDGERVLPIVRSQLKKARAELEAKDAEVSEKLERMTRLTQSMLDRQKAQHQSELDTIKAQMRDAAATGDVDEYARLEAKRDTLEKSKPDEPAQDNSTVESAWIAKNDWYTKDFELAREAQAYSQWLAGQPNPPDMASNLARVETYIKEKFPEKFGATPKPKPNGHPAVEGGNLFPSGGKKSQGFDSLPKEAKDAYSQFVASGVEISKEDYAKEYYNG